MKRIEEISNITDFLPHGDNSVMDDKDVVNPKTRRRLERMEQVRRELREQLLREETLRVERERQERVIARQVDLGMETFRNNGDNGHQWETY